MLDLDTLDSEFSRIVKSADGKTSVAPQLAKAYDDYAKGGSILGARPVQRDACQHGGEALRLLAGPS